MKLSLLKEGTVKEQETIRAAFERIGKNGSLRLLIGLKSRSNLLGETLTLSGTVFSFSDHEAFVMVQGFDLQDGSVAGGPYALVGHPHKLKVMYNELRPTKEPNEFIVR